MRRASLPLILIFALTSVTVAFARAADRFENTKWKVKVEPEDGGAKAFDEIIAFKGGQFTTTELAKRGFGPARYEEDSRGAGGGLEGFTVDMTSKAEGSAKWTGTITAVQITGNLVLTKRDGTVVNYTYRGEKMPER